MKDFDLDPRALHEQVQSARQHAHSTAAERRLERARSGAGLEAGDVARLWFAPIDTDTLYEAACAAHRPRAAILETFSPLYLTNTCDAECRMCGMRRDNRALQRETADPSTVEAQLRVLTARGMRAVALLTGEYAGKRRAWAMPYVNRALHHTQALGFSHVLINVGSIEADEFDTLLSGMPRHADGSLLPKLTMSTFQETYEPRVYAKFMGTDPENPRASFARRLANFDRAFRAGMRVANPGILLGLNADIAYELTALTLHAHHLLNRGMEIYLSVPRLRRIAGDGGPRAIGDADFVRLVALLSLALPQGKIVVTTREDSRMQIRLAPIVSVISAGSAAVVPYTDTGARFPLETSQFEVIDQRPFEAILDEHRRAGAHIMNFEPPDQVPGVRCQVPVSEVN
jgi:2-iminoacetate synthase